MIPVHCPLCCDQPFENQQALFFHLRGLRNNLFCPICSERFGSLEFLVNHLSRTCLGPTSPLVAKKQCLAGIASSNKEDDLSSEKLNTIPDSKTPTAPDSSSSEVEGVRAETTSSVVPEIIHKLSKNVTVSVPSSKGTPEKELYRGELSKLLLKKDVPKAEKSTPKKIPSELALSKIALNSSIDIKVGPSSRTPEKIKDKPSLSITSTNNVKKNNSLVRTVSEAPISPSDLKKLGCSKEERRKSLQDSREKQKPRFLAVPEPDPPGNIERQRPQKRPTQSESTQPKKTVNAEKDRSRFSTMPEPESLIKQHTKKEEVRRKRGRPRKYPLPTDIVGADFDILVKKPAEEYILPDVVKDSELLTTKEGDICREELSPVPHDSCLEEPSHKEENSQSSNGNQSNDSRTNSEDIKEDKEADTKENNHKVDEIVDVKVNPDEKMETKSEEEEEYTCSACNVRFTSIYEHIKEFHNGEEVVVEVPEEEIKEDLKAYQNESEAKVEVDPVTNSEANSSATQNNVTIVDFPSTSEKSSGLVATSSKNVTPSKELPLKVKGEKKSKIRQWFQSTRDKTTYYQFVYDHSKFKRLAKELQDNLTIDPLFGFSVQELFQNAKINVVEITNKPNRPFFTCREVDFQKPIPMYIVEREVKEKESVLGGIASYVIANPMFKSATGMSNDSKIIAVMKVILASDKTLTVENVVFKEKPGNENMVPFLEDVTEPEIPLLKNSKLLKWRCTKCLTTTWKFPLMKTSHSCNGCPVCFKPFASSTSLRKHLVLHKKDGSRFCEECHATFTCKSVLDRHLEMHDSHDMCKLCRLFVPKYQMLSHTEMHNKNPSEQFSCSVCEKLFRSKEAVKTHEVKECIRLVAKYNCPKCDKRFFSPTALSFHSRAHNNVTIKFPCRFCQKSFLKEKEQSSRKAGKRQPSAYIRKIWHERIHLRERPYPCMACPKRFRCMRDQALHIKKAHEASAHTDIPIHMCPICDKKFSNSEQLNEHQKIHSSSSEAFT